jgi:hypothetical protein
MTFIEFKESWLQDQKTHERRSQSCKSNKRHFGLRDIKDYLRYIL